MKPKTQFAVMAAFAFCATISFFQIEGDKGEGWWWASSFAFTVAFLLTGANLIKKINS